MKNFKKYLNIEKQRGISGDWYITTKQCCEWFYVIISIEISF